MSNETSHAARMGVLAMIGACVIWGLSPLYYRLLHQMPPVDILAHRTLWSLMFFVGVLAVQRRLPALKSAVTDRRQLPWIALAAVMISTNWGIFIYAIQVDRVTETSLGYYIFPLVSVLLGLVVFGEGLGRLQWLAVAMAGLAVVVLTIGLGTAPWISLILAASFGIYGLLKKRVSLGPVISVTAEVLVLVPLALIWLAFLAEPGTTGPWTLALLILSGPLTAGPLILFSFAAKRIRLATVGVLQYLNPTLQFLVAVLVVGEPLGLAHAIAFPLIWTAVGLYSGASLVQDRKARKASAKASTLGTA